MMYVEYICVVCGMYIMHLLFLVKINQGPRGVLHSCSVVLRYIHMYDLFGRES